MFYNSSTYNNTNLDESHKQGLELQNLFVVSPKWSTNVNYAYTKAIIDKEADNSLMNGKTNPMTSKHNITASVIYSFSDKTKMTLTQKYRSSAFAEEDYTNTATQKQKAYNSTDFNFSFSPNEDLEFNFDVENIFENSYGTWLRADVIYPGNFTRNINASLSYKF
jgi:iron complex outermembrane receptor protein